ncbi:MAG: polyhydroxyalkanoate depolymerase [Rhodospirillaceae bacterium]
MLYQVYDAQRAYLEPLRLWADAYRIFFSHPLVPLAYTAPGRAIAAAAELFERATRRFGKPVFGLHTTVINGTEVQVVERVVTEKPFCRLLHFKRDTEHRAPKLLLVAPLAGHHSTLLRNTVEALLPSHDIYITDWIDASLVPLDQGTFDLDDHIGYLIDFLRFLGPDTHMIAVCQPVPSALAAVALLAQDADPAQPLSLTLIGGPIDPAAAPTMPSQLARLHPIEWYENAVIARVPPLYPGAGRRVFPGFIQLSGFMSMNMDRHINAHAELFSHLIEGDGDSVDKHKRFYDEYMSVMDMPAEFYLQTIETVFQRRDIALGTLRWRGLAVEPAAIRHTALLTIEGERDDIAAPGQTFAAHALTPNIPAARRRHHLQPGVGHFGLFNGRRWRTEIMPMLATFIAEHEAVMA